MKELIEKACHALRQADAILIGASNGLSIAEGYNIFADNVMQLVKHGPNATYITLNPPHELYIPEEIASKSIALPGDIAITLNRLKL